MDTRKDPMTETAATKWTDASFRAIVAAIPQIVWVADLSGDLVHVNEHMTAYTGLSEQELLGIGWISAVHPDDLPVAVAARETAEQTGAITDWIYRLRRHDGQYRHHLSRAAPVRNEAGEISYWVATCTDVDDRQRERLVQAYFSLLTERLADSLDVDETVKTVAETCVPEIADRAAVHLHLPDSELPEDLAAVAAGGVPRLLAEVDADDGVRSMLLVPIRVRSAVIGVLGLGYTAQSGRRYTAGDVALGEDIAARAATALDNALRFEREHRVSETFQKAALPPQLPQVPGSFLSALYEAGRAEALVGGDWYDAFRMPDGRLILSVGDVAGSGLDAAVMMGSVRQSIRTAAVINPDPAAVLDAVDRIVREMDAEKYVTAFVAVYEAIGGKLKYASAGHPPPLLRDPCGTVTPLVAGGLPLGLRRRCDDRSTAISLEPGSVVLFYTDGLTELERDPVAGEAGLVAALANMDPSLDTARTVCTAVVGGRRTQDDIAALALWYEASLSDVSAERRAFCWTFDNNDAQAAREARHACVDLLQRAGLNDEHLTSAELVLGELVGNVVRHAPGAIDVWLDLSGRAPVIHVLDAGPGFEINPRLPADVMSERGRGLYIIAALAEDFTANRRSLDSGSHVRVVLHGEIRLPDRS